MKERSKTGGYVGLLMLIIVAAIIAFVFWRSDLFSGGAGDAATSTSASSTPLAAPVEQGRSDIQQAEQAKQQLENQYTQQTRGL